MKKMIWWIGTVLAILVAGYAIVQYFIMDGTQAGLVQTKLIFISSLPTLWYSMLFVHAATSIVALVMGPFSLSSKFREKNIKRHRNMGKIYMLSILFGGLTGLYLAFYATGGWIARVGFGMLAVMWLITAYQALIKVKDKRVQDHQKWMIRNYSLTFAAVTLRIWLGLFIWLFGFERFESSYAIIAWLAWVPNLLLAELFIQKKLSKKFAQNHTYVQR